MLCFAMLTTWFAEYTMCPKDKEYLYFSIYPYSEIYDGLFSDIKNDEYQNINIKMLNISENCIAKLYDYKFK